MEASILLIYVLISFKIAPPPLGKIKGGIGPPLEKYIANDMIFYNLTKNRLMDRYSVLDHIN